MTVPEAVQLYCRKLVEDTGAFKDRDKLYAFVRAKKFKGVDESVVSAFKNVLFIDHKFNVEVLLHANPSALQTYLRDLTQKAPVEAELLLEFAITQLIKSNNYNLAVSVLANTLLELELDPSNTRLKAPWLEKLLLKFSLWPQLMHALSLLYSQNAVLASKLASAFLRIFTVHRRPCTALFELKQSTHTLKSDDLYYCMFAMAYQKNPMGALELYDAHSSLHSSKHLQPLIFAAAQAGSYQRLQETFEAIQPSDRTSEQYETILKAVGKLGGIELLENLEKTAESSGKVSLPVYHALIYSYGFLGKIDHVKRIFSSLCKTYEPERLTFTLVLSSLKDSTELQYSFDLVGEMVAEHNIPLTNHELSQLLTMCRPRKETETAKSIFKWAQSLFEPDLASWNAYLNALVEVPHEAWEAAQRMPHTPDIVTFTTLLSHCSRYRDANIGAKVLAAKSELELKSDESWLACLLAYQVRLGKVKAAEATFAVLNEHYKKRSEYFGVLLDLYINSKDLNKAKRLIGNMFRQSVEPGIAFYAKYFRYLVEFGGLRGLDTAYKVAQDLYLKRQFDPDSRLLPRDQLPATAIKPVVRALLKKNDPQRAEKLLQLAGLRDVQAWTVAGLWMEVSAAQRDHEQTLKWWRTFIASLESILVTTASGKRVIPPSLRHVYSTHIESLIETLFAINHYEKALQLPETLKKIGLELTTKNWNSLVKGLVSCPKDEMLLAAFRIAESRLSRNWLASKPGKLIQPLLDGRTISMLYSTMPKLVDLHSFADQVSKQEAWRRMPSLYRYTLAVFARNKNKCT